MFYIITNLHNVSIVKHLQVFLNYNNKKCLHNLFIHANLVRLLIFIVDINIMISNSKIILKKKNISAIIVERNSRLKVSLQKHIKVLHNQGRKNYGCVECGKDFSKAHYLKKHIEFVHNGRRDYNCSKCGKNFKSPEILHI